jgi:hypothetical protein
MLSLTDNKLIAISITTTTLVGVCTHRYPVPHGNCFSVKVKGEEKDYRIVNFYCENLEHLIKEKLLEWPINIVKLCDRTAFIHDIRIPDCYYTDRFCEICCPRDFLPLPQQLRIQRDLESGKLTEREITMEDGRKMIMSTQKIGSDSPKNLKLDWKVEEIIGDPIIFSGAKDEDINT